MMVTSSRFAPFSYEWYKAIMIAKGEVLIERQIGQMKDFSVKLIYNIYSSIPSSLAA